MSATRSNFGLSFLAKMIFGVLTFVLVGLMAQAAWAQAYPNKPITMIAAFPAGGATDFVARLVGKEITAQTGQAVVVENVAGAGGSIGTAKMLAANPDGYTMLLSSPNEAIVTPIAYSSVKYKAEDLQGVAMIGQTNLILVTRKDLGVNSVAELIALAKKSVDKPLTYCTPGIGSPYHLIVEKFNQLAGIKATNIPYAGFAPCIPNLMGGQIDYVIFPITNPFNGMIDNGTFKPLAVLSSSSSQRFPNVPLMKNTKGLEKMVHDIWAGIHISAKTPENVVADVNKAMQKVLASGEIKKVLEATGATAYKPMSVKEVDKMYHDEIVEYRQLAKSIDLKPQQDPK